MYLPTLRPYAAGNYAVQRTARELLVEALLRWRDTPWDRCVLLPVLDEIIAMAPEPDGPRRPRPWSRVCKLSSGVSPSWPKPTNRATSGRTQHEQAIEDRKIAPVMIYTDALQASRAA